MSLDYAILGFLREQAMSGYDLKTVCFDQDARHFWTADQAQVYRTLDRLEHRGLIKARRERQRSRPDRKIYSLTPSGTRELDAWVATPLPLPPVRDPFLVQLRFSGDISDEELLALVRTRREQMQQRLESLRTRAAAISAVDDHSRLLHSLTLDAAIAEARASVDWLDDVIEALVSPDGASRITSPGRQRRLVATPTVPGKDAS